MRCRYRLPKTVCDNLASAMASFWWSSVEHKRKIHWISWNKMCLPKESGGMGFKDLECLNQALLAKQAWRLIQYEDCLMAKVLKGKYYDDQHFIKASLGARPSYAWRSILHGKELLVKGLKHSVGNGRSINVWSEPWMEDKEGICRTPYRRQRFFDANLKVSDVIDTQTRRWSNRVMSDIFVQSDRELLLQNQPSVDEEDSWIWRHTRNGVYSVKTGYDLAYSLHNRHFLMDQNSLPSLNPLKEQIWSLKAPSKIKVFLWKALSGAIAVNDGLVNRGMKCDDRCQTCGLDGESINHVLFSCPLARKTWATSGFPFPQGGFDDYSIYSNVSYLLSVWKNKNWDQEITSFFPWLVWYIWKNRNSLLFEGFLHEGVQVCVKAKEEAKLWFMAQELNEMGEDRESDEVNLRNEGWQRPPVNVVKCNIGMKWSQKRRIMGAAWVLRDSNGVVLLHSRRSFGSVGSKDEAYFWSIVWALESMMSHGCFKVHFASEGRVLVNAINRPKAWPSFRFKVNEIRRLLGNFWDWHFYCETFEANRGARLIAQSAVTRDRFQSYVACGQPRWLSQLFDNEAVHR